MELSNQGEDINVEPPNLVAFSRRKETSGFNNTKLFEDPVLSDVYLYVVRHALTRTDLYYDERLFYH